MLDSDGRRCNGSPSHGRGTPVANSYLRRPAQAVTSDEPLDLDVPVFDLSNPGAIAEFIASLVSGIGRVGPLPGHYRHP